jgi:hypothetical protein
VAGFKRRLLAIRPVPGILSTKIFRLYTFWIFTLLGLGLPYRIWFSRHCDNLRVTVVKETYAEMEKSSWWFTSSSKPAQSKAFASIQSTSKEVFRQQMEDMLLYSKQPPAEPSTGSLLAAVEDGNSTKSSPPPQPPNQLEQSELPIMDTTEEAREAQATDEERTLDGTSSPSGDCGGSTRSKTLEAAPNMDPNAPTSVETTPSSPGESSPAGKDRTSTDENQSVQTSSPVKAEVAAHNDHSEGKLDQ